jgi:hypothetical protein
MATVGVSDLLQGFDAITLAGMASVSLDKRVEQKYVMKGSLLGPLLMGLMKDYFVLEIGELRQFSYTTYYFDTPELRLYMDHHNGYANRMKVRQRRYDDSGDCYFEVKSKTKGVITEKWRYAIGGLSTELAPDYMAGIKYSRIPGEALRHTLTNRFLRISFCDRQLRERVTIDTCMRVNARGKKVEISNIALAEIKQARFNIQSPAVALLRAFGIHCGPFSKYATGVALLYPEVKHNNIKPALLKTGLYGTE